MIICPHCGKEYHAEREKVPWWRYDPGGPTVSLGCGTLLLIGIVAGIFSRGGNDNLEYEVRSLHKEVTDVRKAVETQSREIQKLSDRLAPVEKAEKVPNE
jgi:hypothetical protein